MSNQMRMTLIKAGVRNLKEFGYPTVNEKNILTDDVFKRFFVSMLRDNLGQGADDAINALLKELGEEVDAG
jgi:hypothetical protein